MAADTLENKLTWGDLTGIEMQEPPMAPHAIPLTQPQIKCISATFYGLYFRGVATGKEAVPFERTLNIPESWLRNKAMHPAWVFQKFAQQLLGREGTYGGVRTVDLKSTSPLPDGLEPEEKITWTASYQDMLQLAKMYGTKRSFTPLDPADGKPLKSETVSINFEFYPTVKQLRDAIRRIMTEPEAFKKAQDKLALLWPDKQELQNMEAEMKALNPELQ